MAGEKQKDMSQQVRVLGIDLGSVRWQDNGTAVLTFERTAAPQWLEVSWAVIPWPKQTALNSATMAEVIDQYARENEIAAVSFDGPHGWREPHPEPARCQRLGEQQAKTQGKTGPYGTTYPANQMRWFTFCIELFEQLLSLRGTRLANDPEQRVLPVLPKQSYWLLECYPTSTWRRSQLRALPGKTNRICTRQAIDNFAAALWQRFALPSLDEWTGSHDDLQAVVSALPAAALLGGPCQAVPQGQAGWIQKATEQIPQHWVEGVVWDATPPVGAALEPIDIAIPTMAKRPAATAPDHPLILQNLASNAAKRACNRGVALFKHLLKEVTAGKPVGIGYKQFACFVHGVAPVDYRELVGRGWSQTDVLHVLALARQISNEAGGPQQVEVAKTKLTLGMDDFIWQQKRPHNRPPTAFSDTNAEARWKTAFPDGERRLITQEELTGLSHPA